MPQLLKDIVIREVSAVDRGAGEGVRVLLMKRADQGQRTEDTMPATFSDADAALLAKLRKRADKKAAKIAKRAEAEKAMLPSEKTFYDALVEKSDRKSFRKMSAEERAVVVKAGKMPPKKKAPPGKDDDGDEDDVGKLIDSANADTLAKALSANRSLEQRIAKMEQDDALRIAKADAKDMGFQESDGEMLMKARTGDKDAVAALEKALKKMREQRDEAVRTGGILKELGNNGGGGAKTAYDELNALAADLRKREPKLSEAQAFDKVISDPANRDLVARESQERISKIQRVAA